MRTFVSNIHSNIVVVKSFLERKFGDTSNKVSLFGGSGDNLSNI
ncbi:MAG: hypothetical protein RL431_1065, partial [Actinomycetota bacterium]